MHPVRAQLLLLDCHSTRADNSSRANSGRFFIQNAIITFVKLSVAGDHAGYALKKILAEQLRSEGHEVLDLGAFDETRSDYPDWAKALGLAIRAGKSERGILLCGSGAGASIAANKMRGIRASVCHDHYSAHQAVEHDDMNVLVLGARVIGQTTALDCAHAFIGATYLGTQPYAERLDKVRQLEDEM